MRKAKFIIPLLLMLFVSIGNVWGYTISFKSTSGADGSTTQTTIANVISDGSSYVSSISCDRIYNGKSGYGIKLGASGNTGNITLTMATSGKIKPTKITVRACRYGSDTGNLNYKINGGTQSSKTLTSSLANYEITMDGNTTLSTLYLASSSKRIYIESVTIEAGSTYTVD